MSDTDDCDYDEDYNMEAYEHDDNDSPLTMDPEHSKAVKHGDEDQDDGEEDTDGGDMTWDDDDLMALVASTYALDEVTQEMVQEAVALAQTHLADPDVIQLTPLGPKFTLSVKRNSPHARITVSHGVDGQPSTSSEQPNPRFSIGIQLVSSVQKFIQERWSRKDETFLVDLYTLAVEHLTNCGNVCMLCDRQLPFPGLKPTICEDKLCSYQLEKLGIGAGLGLIDTDIAVADFLICTCLAAASSRSRIPFALPSMPTAEGMDDIILPGRIVKALSVTPVLAELPKADNARANALKGVEPLLETIMRWIFATNRAHVVSMPEDEQFTEMTTGHQFRISTSIRACASAFESMKQLHGSFFQMNGNGRNQNASRPSKRAKTSKNTKHQISIDDNELGMEMDMDGMDEEDHLDDEFDRVTTALKCRERKKAWPQQLQQTVGYLTTKSERLQASLGGALCDLGSNMRHSGPTAHCRTRFTSRLPPASPRRCPQTWRCSASSCPTSRPSQRGDAPKYGTSSSTPHNILRNNLKNASNLPIMSAGPAYGPSRVWNSQFEWNLRILALCEDVLPVRIHHTSGTITCREETCAMPAIDRKTDAESDNAALPRKIPANIFTKFSAVGRICVTQDGEAYSQSTEAIVELKTYLERMPTEIKNDLEKAPFEV
ncbi:hypothetical protein CALVIDRAFT_542943, partial [Calocera viscosa TUFC12733]